MESDTKRAKLAAEIAELRRRKTESIVNATFAEVDVVIEADTDPTTKKPE